jgi:diguanylate cyclase (GGDEF)-like protein
VRQDGSRFWGSSIISVLQDLDGQGIGGYSVITRDITERKKSEDELRKIATTDFLTGVLNRRSFFAHAEKQVALSLKTGSPCCFLALDADFFKRINDRFGHPIGDEVLKKIAAVCQASVRSADVVARLGGEEFSVILPTTTKAQALVVAERIRAAIEKSAVLIPDQEVRFTVSLGVADFWEGLDESLQRADAALYLAKKEGRNCVRCCFASELVPSGV